MPLPDGLHPWWIESLEWARLFAFLAATGLWVWIKGRGNPA